jgi:curved DNA-binding protein CbpA
MKSFYDILEVSSASADSEIRTAYLRLAREYHPDRVPEHLTKLRGDAEEKTKQLNEAWSVLGNAAKRKRYDSMLRCQPEPTTYRPSSEPATKSRPTVRVTMPTFLRTRRDIVQWALAIGGMTLILIAIGEIFAFRSSITQPQGAGSRFSNTGQDAGPYRVLHYDLQPIHLKGARSAGRSNFSLQLLSVALSESKTVVTFRACTGEHRDFLLYEPPGGSSLERSVLGKRVVVDRGMEELYLFDDSGTKYYSTSGLLGGEQLNFDLYNFTRRINLSDHQQLVLSVEFPALPRTASSVTFVSPALANWQPEWRVPSISLK